MRFRLLGSSGLRVSEACLGTAVFGEEGWGTDRQQSERIVDTYLEAGGQFIDVANVYAAGRAEELLGAIVKPRRDELVIGTKFTASMRPGDPNAWGNHRKNLRQSLEASLRRLQTDYVDVLWVHCWDELTPVEEIMRALDDEVRAGRVLYVGVSNTPAWTVARANTLAELRGWSPFVGLQTEYSLVSRTPEHEQIPMARSLGLQVLAWSPLGGGVLAGGYTGADGQVGGKRYRLDTIPPRRLKTARAVAAVAEEIGEPLAAVALAWLRQRATPLIPILGARTVEQLQGNLRALDLVLDADVLDRLDALSAPTPIMPREGLDVPGVDVYFNGGIGAILRD